MAGLPKHMSLARQPTCFCFHGVFEIFDLSCCEVRQLQIINLFLHDFFKITQLLFEALVFVKMFTNNADEHLLQHFSTVFQRPLVIDFESRFNIKKAGECMPAANHKKRRLEFLSLDCAYHCEITRSKSLRHTSHSSGHFFWNSCLPTSLSNESCISKRCFAQTLVVSVLAFKIKRYSAFDKVSPYSANQLTQGYDLRDVGLSCCTARNTSKQV